MTSLAYELPTLKPIKGIRIATANAGIKHKDRDDITVFEIAKGSRTAAVFTRNQFCAAPVLLARKHLLEATPRYLLINSGNANAGTGTKGLQAAAETCQALATTCGANVNEILPFSTGVIGEQLPVNLIVETAERISTNFDAENWSAAALAIMTTDTVPKAYSKSINLDGAQISITGIAKGAGMICPNMATMLGFIATDVRISQALLHQTLTHAVDESFNRITVDGDTSTNDACVIMATGQSGISEIDSENDSRYPIFCQLITECCTELAKAIIKDAEGATKFITVMVMGGETESECKLVAYTIAHSPLVKTAFFASDPNWGRLLAAVGRAGLKNLDISKVAIYLDEICVARHGQRAEDYSEELGRAVMSKSEITVRIELGLGTAVSSVWTCDLSYDYVKINAEYRT